MHESNRRLEMLCIALVRKEKRRLLTLETAFEEFGLECARMRENKRRLKMLCIALVRKENRRLEIHMLENKRRFEKRTLENKLTKYTFKTLCIALAFDALLACSNAPRC